MALIPKLCRVLTLFAFGALSATSAAASPWQAASLPPAANTRYGQHYLLALPEGYEADPQRAWPVIVFLHGAGEWGTDLARVKTQGLGAFVEGGGKLPAIVIAPQTPRDQLWHPLFVDAVLREVAARYRIDAERIYLTGLSLGGMGTWSTALAYPGRFAALAPVAGAFPNDMLAYNLGRPEPTAADWLPAIRQLTHLPVWIAHGEADPVVPFAMDRRVAAVLKQLGMAPRLEWMANVGHDAWTRTYAETPAFYEWLFAQRRSAAPPAAPAPGAELAGRYRASNRNTAEVTVLEDRVDIAMGDGERIEFLPINRRQFIGPFLIRFEDDAQGAPRALAIPGIGRFERQH
ncbi:prolyl oligopeptidase family serine peptidase [Niveibacterium sp. 24ML]|uniref:carboxylesterase family protein n=1 Tax=Niveibacterium sp. 24ML TaxID=2985512 RepID=UPI002270D102|nr:PHB depolymerase family esterase [Niveibacterium sp. 24ML]MCX9155616.1 prolyl oligopeptidase family serine peptidase [Niveibacterium sp. 24ML]